MNLNRSMIFKGMKHDLIAAFGIKEATLIWNQAQKNLRQLEQEHPQAEKNETSFVFPSVAIYQAIEQASPGQALEITRAYGTKTGLHLRNLFLRITALPGIPYLLWKKMPAIAKKMSEGYQTEEVVVTDHLCSLHVTGCPMFDGAKKLGVPEAAQMICCMDKEYMTGFRGVKYTRHKSLAEGDAYCDYLLEDART